jgi:hypothetical protein
MEKPGEGSQSPPVQADKCTEGPTLGERVAELLNGRDFVLVVDSVDKAGAGEIFAQAKGGDVVIELLELALEACKTKRRQAQQ